MYYIRKRVAGGDFVAGTWCSLALPAICEIIGESGYDWLLIDMEHAPGTPVSLLQQLQAVRGFSLAPIVRVPALDRAYVKWALDLGASGIMFPGIDTAEQAAEAVSFMRYDPHGVRGVSGAARCAGYGRHFSAYVAEADENLLTVVQIESARAVKNCEAIARTDGVDVLFVGPMDLSTSLGLPGRFADPRFMDVLRQVAHAACAAGRACGILLPDPGLVPHLRDMGYTFVAVSSDTNILVKYLAEYRQQIGREA